MTPERIAEDIADAYEDAAASRRGPDILVSEVYTSPAGLSEFYIDVHQPGESNQRFTVTVTESTDIRT